MVFTKEFLSDRQKKVNESEIRYLQNALLIKEKPEKWQLIASKRVGNRIISVRVNITPQRIICNYSDADPDELPITCSRRAVVVEQIIALYTHRGDIDFYEQVDDFVKNLNK